MPFENNRDNLGDAEPLSSVSQINEIIGGDIRYLSTLSVSLDTKVSVKIQKIVHDLNAQLESNRTPDSSLLAIYNNLQELKKQMESNHQGLYIDIQGKEQQLERLRSEPRIPGQPRSAHITSFGIIANIGKCLAGIKQHLESTKEPSIEQTETRNVSFHQEERFRDLAVEANQATQERHALEQIEKEKQQKLANETVKQKRINKKIAQRQEASPTTLTEDPISPTRVSVGTLTDSQRHVLQQFQTEQRSMQKILESEETAQRTKANEAVLKSKIKLIDSELRKLQEKKEQLSEDVNQLVVDAIKARNLTKEVEDFEREAQKAALQGVLEKKRTQRATSKVSSAEASTHEPLPEHYNSEDSKKVAAGDTEARSQSRQGSSQQDDDDDYTASTKTTTGRPPVTPMSTGIREPSKGSTRPSELPDEKVATTNNVERRTSELSAPIAAMEPVLRVNTKDPQEKSVMPPSLPQVLTHIGPLTKDITSRPSTLVPPPKPEPLIDASLGQKLARLGDELAEQKDRQSVLSTAKEPSKGLIFNRENLCAELGEEHRSKGEPGVTFTDSTEDSPSSQKLSFSDDDKTVTLPNNNIIKNTQYALNTIARSNMNNHDKGKSTASITIERVTEQDLLQILEKFNADITQGDGNGVKGHLQLSYENPNKKSPNEPDIQDVIQKHNDLHSMLQETPGAPKVKDKLEALQQSINTLKDKLAVKPAASPHEVMLDSSSHKSTRFS